MAKKYSGDYKNLNKTTSKNQNSDSSLTRQSELIASTPVRWPVIPVAIVFIFLLTLIGSMDNIVEKWMGLLSAVVTLGVLIAVRKTDVLKKYSSPLFFSFIAYIIWGGISTFYAASGKFAIFEFSKLLFALCIYLLVLFFAGSEESGFKKVSYVLASTGCFYGIISIDAASSGLLSGLFKSFFALFTSVYDDRGVFEEGIRTTGIFGNPNIYAGFMAIAVFLSLYLVISASDKKNARISSALLAVNALAYLLAFSLGSLFMFLIACLIMIGMSEKGKRINLFILMSETAILGLVFAFISMAGLGKTGSVSFVPLVAVIVNAILLYSADSKIRAFLNNKLEGNGKLSLQIAALLVILMIGYLIAAFNVSGTLTLEGKETIMRAIYVPGGEYTLSVESSNPVNLTIESQNENDLIKHTTTRLYKGSTQKEVSFTVPDGSRIVQLHFAAEEAGSKIHSAQYSGASTGNVHLGYPLLPSIIANRLQNIFANENMIQRGIFFEDGIKLFSKSPVIGRGLGGFENGVYAVQDFYYETKYAHNHYIQVLSDLGIIGLGLFLCILIFSVVSVLRSRNRRHSLFAVPVLAACLFQSFGQAVTDAIWSTGVFLGFAAAILALVTINCTQSIRVKESFNKNYLQFAEKSVLVVFTAAFILLLSGNLYAQAQAKAGVKSFDDIEHLISIDRFEYNDYKVSYILNANKIEDDEIHEQANIYADELIKVESNSIAPYVMAYKFINYFDFDAFEAAKQGVENSKSNPTLWISIFNILEEYIDPVGPHVDDAADRLRKPKYYVSSILEIYRLLLERNENSLDDITLTPYNNAFIGKMLEIEATHQYNVDWVFTAIMTYAFDSECAVDANLDGLPDALKVLKGSVTRTDDNSLAVSDHTSFDLTLYHKLRGKYTFQIETETPQQGLTVSLNGAPLEVVYDGDEAYVTVDMDDNSDRSLSKFTVVFPAAAEIRAITYTTKLE